MFVVILNRVSVEDDPAGAFAALVGRFAASLDRGVDAAEAFRASIVEGGWERTAG